MYRKLALRLNVYGKRAHTASPHHACSASRSALRYASTTSGTMYSRNSRSKLSIVNVGSSAFISRCTCALSFSSNQPPIVCVTLRKDDTTGCSLSSYCALRSESERKSGFVSFIFAQRSCRGESACTTSA